MLFKPSTDTAEKFVIVRVQPFSLLAPFFEKHTHPIEAHFVQWFENVQRGKQECT